MILKRTVRDIMTDTVIVAREDMVITDVIGLLLRWHISGLPVVDSEDNLVGIITERDLMNFAISGEAASTKVSEVMTTKVEVYTPDALVADVVNHFASQGIRRIPVVKERKVVGIVSRRDILRELNRIYNRIVTKVDIEIEI